MIETLFTALSRADGWLAVLAPELARICLWGAIAAALAMAVYLLLSNQEAIQRLSSETKDIRRRMLDPSSDHAEFLRLSKHNLQLSFSYLGRTIVPSMVAGLPVLVIVLWLQAFQSFVVPLPGTDIALQTDPEGIDLTVEPQPFRGASAQSLRMVDPDEAIHILGPNGQTIYEGHPLSPPTDVVTKRHWWHLLLGAPNGYIDEAAPIEALRLHLERKTFISGVPGWAATWELPFFLSVLMVAVAIKVLFRIH